MAFQRNNWISRVGVGLNKWRDLVTGTLLELVNEPDSITVAGTPFQAAWMNNIEEAAAQASDYIEPDSVVSQLINITTPSDDVTRFFIEIDTLITGGNVTVNRNGEGALNLYSDYALTEQVTELEPGVYEIIDRGTAFLQAPRGGAIFNFKESFTIEAGETISKDDIVILNDSGNIEKLSFLNIPFNELIGTVQIITDTPEFLVSVDDLAVVGNGLYLIVYVENGYTIGDPVYIAPALHSDGITLKILHSKAVSLIVDNRTFLSSPLYGRIECVNVTTDNVFLISTGTSTINGVVIDKVTYDLSVGTNVDIGSNRTKHFRRVPGVDNDASVIYETLTPNWQSRAVHVNAITGQVTAENAVAMNFTNSHEMVGACPNDDSLVTAQRDTGNDLEVTAYRWGSSGVITQGVRTLFNGDIDQVTDIIAFDDSATPNNSICGYIAYEAGDNDTEVYKFSRQRSNPLSNPTAEGTTGFTAPDGQDPYLFEMRGLGKPSVFVSVLNGNSIYCGVFQPDVSTDAITNDPRYNSGGSIGFSNALGANDVILGTVVYDHTKSNNQIMHLSRFDANAGSAFDLNSFSVTTLDDVLQTILNGTIDAYNANLFVGFAQEDGNEGESILVTTLGSIVLKGDLSEITSFNTNLFINPETGNLSTTIQPETYNIGKVADKQNEGVIGLKVN